MKNILFLLAVILMFASSCTSKSGKLHKERESTPLVHPDHLQSHILINKGITHNDRTKIAVYNYQDSIYREVFLPTIYVEQMSLLDTISNCKFIIK